MALDDGGCGGAGGSLVGVAANLPGAVAPAGVGGDAGTIGALAVVAGGDATFGATGGAGGLTRGTFGVATFRVVGWSGRTGAVTLGGDGIGGAAATGGGGGVIAGGGGTAPAVDLGTDCFATGAGATIFGAAIFGGAATFGVATLGATTFGTTTSGAVTAGAANLGAMAAGAAITGVSGIAGVGASWLDAISGAGAIGGTGFGSAFLGLVGGVLADAAGSEAFGVSAGGTGLAIEGVSGSCGGLIFGTDLVVFRVTSVCFLAVRAFRAGRVGAGGTGRTPGKVMRDFGITGGGGNRRPNWGDRGVGEVRTPPGR